MTLLVAYNADEASGPVLDVTGNGHDISLGSNLTRVAGHTNTGMAKNNVGFPVVASPAIGQTTARTFMFWLRGAGNGTWIFRFYNIADDTGTWGLYLIGSTLNLRLRKGGSNTNTTFAFPGDGLDHHYAGTYDGSNARLYIDGVLVATSSTVAAPLDNADRIEILEGSITSQIMDDLRVYDEALTQPQIATLKDTPVVAPDDDASAVLAGTLLRATMAGSAEVTAAATLAGTGLRATLVGSALVTAQADLEGTLPRATLVAEATVTADAAIAATLPRATMQADADVEAEAVFAGLLHRATALFVVQEEIPETAELNALLLKVVAGTGITTGVSNELRWQRLNTQAFIEASPVDIQLIPQEEQRKPSGAVTLVDQAARPEQRFRLIPMSHTERPFGSTSGLTSAGNGQQRKYDLTLLGNWDAVMSPNDYWFDVNGQKLVVDAVIPYNGYEVKGLVMSYGRRGSIV